MGGGAGLDGQLCATWSTDGLGSDGKYQLQYADFFEQAWILMADYYISVNKYDLAEGELKNCLKYNKSMIKAEELMGLIKEKEKAYVDAAEHYAVAWKMYEIMKRSAKVTKWKAQLRKAEKQAEELIATAKKTGASCLAATPQRTRYRRGNRAHRAPRALMGPPGALSSNRGIV